MFDPATLTAVWTAANGDTVDARTDSFELQVCLDPPDCNVFTYKQVLTITGGTGRFENATGGGTVEGVFSFVDGIPEEFDGYLKGTISRPNSGR